jgi:hypothetical protein
MASLVGRRPSWRWAVVPALALTVTGCTSTASPATHPPQTSGPGGQPASEGTAQERFTVLLSPQARQLASSAGVNLSRLVANTLDRINALLPGPATTIAVTTGSASLLIPQAGVSGDTSRGTGQVFLAFGQTAHATLTRTLDLWLPRDAAHEVNHSVRILGGTGFGTTLLQQMISEGIATAFDQVVFPGPPDPWDQAITPAQECVSWKKAEPQLGGTGLYDLWMFGGPGVPLWTAFTIGYHVVNDYRNHHPDVSWATLTSTSAATILTGSHYQPCPR